MSVPTMLVHPEIFKLDVAHTLLLSQRPWHTLQLKLSQHPCNNYARVPRVASFVAPNVQ